MERDQLERLHERANAFANLLFYRYQQKLSADRFVFLYRRAREIEQARRERLRDYDDAAYTASLEAQAMGALDWEEDQP